VWAIESARGLGYLLAQQLVATGETVVDAPAMLSTRARLLGSGRAQKNDPNDARSVAIAALRNPDLCRVGRDDHARVLKLLVKRHRDLGRLKNKTACRLHALLMELVPGGMAASMTVTRANTLIDSVDDDAPMVRHRVAVARELADDIAHYDRQRAASTRRLRAAVAASGTTLTGIAGVGPVTAAMIIGQTGDVTRFPTAGHFASYNATAPIEASARSRHRHRLNPRGNRQLNWAIHMIAICQLRHPGPGRDYYDRKRIEGKSTKETIRALKRRLSDIVYRTMLADTRRAN
jgi:transposase